MANNRVRVAVSAAGLVAGGIVAMASAAPASAWATGCNVYDSTHSAQLQCTSGTGEFRLATVCENQFGARGTYYGAWSGIGGWSNVQCPYTNGLQGYSIENDIRRR
jgi:hypothetical protein